eukprot:4608614-Amphidinium_carterae.1
MTEKHPDPKQRLSYIANLSRRGASLLMTMSEVASSQSRSFTWTSVQCPRRALNVLSRQVSIILRV